VEALFTGGPPETIHTRDGISVASFPRHRSDHYFLHVDNAKEASRRNQITLNRFDVDVAESASIAYSRPTFIKALRRLERGDDAFSSGLLMSWLLGLDSNQQPSG
jgi:hypothetical protein